LFRRDKGTHSRPPYNLSPCLNVKKKNQKWQSLLCEKLRLFSREKNATTPCIASIAPMEV
jgi:hypothetical protein